MPHGKIELNTRRLRDRLAKSKQAKASRETKQSWARAQVMTLIGFDARCESSRLLYPNRNAKAKKSLAYPTCRIELLIQFC